MTESEVFKNGCNMGARHARGRYLVFLSDEAVAESGWLPEFYSSFHLLATPRPESTSLIVVQPPSFSPSPPPQPLTNVARPSPGRGGSPASQFEVKQRGSESKKSIDDKYKPKEGREKKKDKEGKGKDKEDEKKMKDSEGGTVGLLACKLVYSKDQLIHSAGLGVSLSVKSTLREGTKEEQHKKKKKANEDEDIWSWWVPSEKKQSHEDEEAREVLWHYRRLTGYVRMDDRADVRERVLGPAHHCFAVSRRLFLLMDGMNDRLEVQTPASPQILHTTLNDTRNNTAPVHTKVIRLDPSLQVVDLSLRVKQRKDFSSEYAPTFNAVVLSERAMGEKEGETAMTMRDDGVQVMNDQVLGFFENRKDALATVWLEESPARMRSDVDLVWDFYGGCTGWGLEAVSYITALESRVKVSKPFFFCYSIYLLFSYHFFFYAEVFYLLRNQLLLLFIDVDSGRKGFILSWLSYRSARESRSNSFPSASRSQHSPSSQDTQQTPLNMGTTSFPHAISRQNKRLLVIFFSLFFSLLFSLRISVTYIE